MRPRLGTIVQVHAGTHGAQDRYAAIVTKVHGETIVDLTVFPGGGAAPFTMRSVKRAVDDDRASSTTESVWQPIVD